MSATRRIGVRRDASPVTTYLRAFGTRASATSAPTRRERGRADATTGAVKRALRDITRRRG